MDEKRQEEANETDIAIVGMACRFPGAGDPEAFWRNLRDGVESVRALSDDELRAAGVPQRLIDDPSYVKSCAPLENMAWFDSEFFGMSPKDSAIMDPQHRHFLECCWEALESAGHPPARFPGAIGVYAGCGMNGYLMFNLLTNPQLMSSVGLFLVRHTGNDKDFLSTRVSFELNLRGPSVSVQTACSTSLVAIHMAAQSLLSRECDMALAGGVTIEQPHGQGYLYVDGEVLSPNGHCRPFDHRSAGTVFGSGVGIVVLRRLADALADGDTIHAIVKGSAVNNDGSNKAGYLAPSVEGQAGAIAEALEVAGLDADAISYVEAHGTGTAIGDPIEVAALTEAFRATSERRGFCGLGSVKGNIGHLDTAAGVASVIKVVQGLRHEQLPPSLGFEAPNPNCGFETSPFFVNASLRDWPRGAEPRRAGVSSLGVGGTNAHLVLEEAPVRETSGPSRAWQLLTLSARNPDALDAATQRLADDLRAHPERPLADVAYTLQLGRAEFAARRSLVCRDVPEALALLGGAEPARVHTRRAPEEKQSVAFLFPGGGAQYPRMALDLYESERVFREHVDRGLARLLARHGIDLRPVWFAAEDALEDAAVQLTRPSLQLPALFILEYALVQLWISWGVRPSALIGHSMGENTAACVADVLSFEDALGLVALRGQLVERVPGGGMLSVALPADELKPLLGSELELAAVNAPRLCVATGPEPALAALEKRLAEREVDAQRIKIDIAGHSAMLDPILREFGDYMRGIKLRPPKIPFVSNTTGTWISDAEATDPEYWVRHLRSTVRFADGIGVLLERADAVLLEVGPGKTLSSLARQSASAKPGQAVLASLRHPNQRVSDAEFLLDVLGQLWTAGVEVAWPELYKDEQRLRVPLPTYAFQRQRYWIEPGALSEAPRSQEERTRLEKIESLSDWFHRPLWRAEPHAPEATPARGKTWLLFLDVLGVGARLAARLRAEGERVVTVREGDTYYRIGDAEYALAPESGRAGYDALLADLAAGHDRPDRIVHLWTLTADRSARPGSSFYHHVQERGFFSLTLLAQALGDQTLEGELQLTVVTNGAQQVGDEPLLYPEKATLAGPCKVIPQEFAGIHCTRVDVELPAPAGLFTRQRAARELDALASRLVGEVSLASGNQSVALRAGERWTQDFERTRVEARSAGSRLKDDGVYLITGGLGGLGLVLAEHLARTRRAKLVLVGRTPLPEREEWDAWLAAKGPEDATRRKLRTLRELERFGAEVLALSADVANLQQMQAVLERARARFGRVDGVFHAAGILDDGLIQTKTQTAIEEVFAPKIQGALVLDQLLADSDVGFVVLFSSTSALLGAAGQIDYVAANAFLDAFARARSAAAGPSWIAVDWGVWSDVGMGAEMAQRRVPAKAGPSASTAALEGTPAKHPLLGRRVASAERESVFAAELSPAAHWILDQHRTRSGKALLPGTGYLELARAAHQESGAAGVLEIRDLYFLQPLQVDDGTSRRLRVSLRQEADGAALEVSSAPLGESAGSTWEQNALGQLAVCTDAPPTPLDLDAILARCGARHTPRDPHGIRTRQEREHLRFGSRWRCLREIWWGAGEALAELELPADHAAELDAYALHPALLDLATGYAMELIEGYAGSDRLFVPLSYRCVRVHAPLASRVFSHVRNAGENLASKEISSFDVSIADATGRVLLEIEGFTIKRLDDSAKFAERVAAPAQRATIDASAASSPAERAFLRTVELGIRRHEGTEALERLLAADVGPQVIVSSIPLDALIEQVHAAAPPATSSGAKFGRPSLATEFKAPRDALESTLAELWRELLGVDRVGVEDDFFALGGHSLIAVRLFVQIKKKLGADHPISVLYEAPTIARLANLIREKHGETEAEGAAGAKPKFRFLVPMHGAEGGAKQPFFLVAGMFGNVLNLRHLADLIGKDRPFYAIQARGLYGGDQPHESFEEMATDYLEEIRRVQPRGPYLLGGFSGGGIAAYEMAQQLTAAGERVAALVFLDTATSAAPDALQARDKVLVHLQRLRRQGPVYLARWLRQRVRWEIERRRARDEEASQSFEFRSSEIEAAFYRALGRYETRAYAGPVTLFRPPLPIVYRLGGGRILNADRKFIYPDNSWSRYVTGELEVSEVPGDHDSMVLEPNVRVLAERLKACLARAGESRSAGTSPR